MEERVNWSRTVIHVPARMKLLGEAIICLGWQCGPGTNECDPESDTSDPLCPHTDSHFQSSLEVSIADSVCYQEHKIPMS